VNEEKTVTVMAPKHITGLLIDPLAGAELVPVPVNGRGLRDLIGGFAEGLTGGARDWVCYVDEDGKVRAEPPPPNPVASVLARALGWRGGVRGDDFANRRVRALTACSLASHARKAFAAYASTPTGNVMLVSRCKEGQIPGSGETRPKPVFWAMPTHPDHTSAAAGAARTSSGQDRTALARRAVAWARTATDGPVV
jgi:hypothetical protein